MIDKIKKIDYRHYICIAISISFLSLSIFYFKYADDRIIESFADLKNSCLFYINSLFDLNLNGKLTINEFSSVPLELPFNLPNNWEDFKILWGDYWSLWASKENLINYLTSLGNGMYYVSKILLIILPILLVFLIVKCFNKDKIDNNYNEDSKPLKVWKNFEKKVYLPVKTWIIRFIQFTKDNSIYWKLWLVIWFYNFNGIAILIEFIAYYLYFVCTFKTTTLYLQILKLFIDLSVLINFFHPIIWGIVGFIIINLICKRIGYERLEHMELKDRGYINERPIVLMLNGTMGSKKTTMITDIALTQEIMFRDIAFERLLKADLKFPFFPWINLENSVKKGMQKHYIYNLATCKKFVFNRKKFFLNHLKDRNIWGYDFKRYGMEYDDNLTINSIWDVIETYVQLYFIYIIESSLLISNYSIRVDNILESVGNFPLWNVDLFRRDTRLMETYTRHAHILDFDMLRLGKQMVDFNEKADCFEFGIINITEIGKERKNSIELQGVKKDSEEANQKNDLFNTTLKMIRHSATVDNVPFVKIICDDQRPESWGADARDLTEIVFIEKTSEVKNARPLFFFYDFFFGWLISRFKNKYYTYRYKFGGNTLKMYLYHGLISKLNAYLVRNINTFGYYKLDTSIESGRLDGETKKTKYYLMFKKVYSKRFSTDCFSDFFTQKALCSKIGLNDLEEFADTKASFEEMLTENSYFFNDLIGLGKR
ncbi:MAG: hypothetical protein K2N64_01085 [Anaeroplasmataceae bacterium]|nr:hypothetical protein [Anaeroplasmataceae bacterium]